MVYDNFQNSFNSCPLIEEQQVKRFYPSVNTDIVGAMENQNASYSNDFLSNGLYQLYTTQYEDEILLWDSEDPKLNVSEDLTFRSADNECLDYGNFEVISDAIKCEEVPDDYSTELWSLPLESNLTKIGGDWELNIENLLFDNCVECPEWKLTNEPLPDKTVFCSDSCNLFLKESSESLLSNLNSFAPEKNAILSTDMANSEQDKLFVCTFKDCKKVYAKSAHLKAHLRRHIGLKPYVCLWPNCTWKFSRSDELSRHRRSHSGVKPYQCLYCTKCFSRSDHLTKHRKVHERKMAAMKLKTIWSNLPHYGRQGRKSKASQVLFKQSA